MRARLAHLALAPLLALSLAGCIRRPTDAILICHNANCAAPGTVDKDDDLGALANSLHLQLDGKPALDGYEIDVVWERTVGQCQFAHGAGTNAPAVEDAVALIADHLARPGPASWNGDRFYMKMELKPDVDAAGDDHDATDMVNHAECILDQIDTIESVALAHDRKVTFLLDSAEPALLDAITQRPRWTGKHTGERFEIKFEVDYATSVPDGFDPDVFTIRWGEIDEHMRAEFRARGKEVLTWGRDPSVSTLDDVAYLSPTFIGSNQAILIRQWLQNGE